MPRKPQTHIQKMAPGPPRQIAPATPTRFPVPTVAANAVQRAWKEDTPSFFSGETSRRKKSLSARGSRTSWGTPSRTVRYRPTPRIRSMAGISGVMQQAYKRASVMALPYSITVYQKLQYKFSVFDKKRGR